jgi:hypothetical protein
MSVEDRSPAGRITTALHTISDCYDDTLEPARRGNGSHVLTSMVNPPLPVSADVLDKRAKAHERLAWWALQTMRGQHLHRLVTIEVKALCAYLTKHADYVAQWPKALADLEGSAADLGTIAAQNAPRHQDVGHCPGTTNGLPCKGMVTATVRRDDDLLPSSLVCDATPSHAWPAGVWKTLERRIHADAGVARREAQMRRAGMDETAARSLAVKIRSCDTRHNDGG